MQLHRVKIRSDFFYVVRIFAIVSLVLASLAYMLAPKWGDVYARHVAGVEIFGVRVLGEGRIDIGMDMPVICPAAAAWIWLIVLWLATWLILPRCKRYEDALRKLEGEWNKEELWKLIVAGLGIGSVMGLLALWGDPGYRYLVTPRSTGGFWPTIYVAGNAFVLTALLGALVGGFRAVLARTSSPTSTYDAVLLPRSRVVIAFGVYGLVFWVGTFKGFLGGIEMLVGVLSGVVIGILAVRIGDVVWRSAVAAFRRIFPPQYIGNSSAPR